MTETYAMIIYTIGHSNHPLDKFVKLLKTHGISAIADVRSQPYSKYSPQFNSETLSAALKAEGIAYVFLGKELGARPDNPSCMENGHVSFCLLSRTEEFRRGIERLIEGIAKHRIAVMCAEKDPLECHRTILVARQLRARGILIKHILSDGCIEEQRDVEKRLVRLVGIEPDLFGPPAAPEDLLERAYQQQAENIAQHVKTVKGAS